jgi:hypothetical protein
MEVVFADRLKPHLGSGPLEATTLVKRGRSSAHPGGGKEDKPSPVALADEGWTVVTSRGWHRETKTSSSSMEVEVGGGPCGLSGLQ